MHLSVHCSFKYLKDLPESFNMHADKLNFRGQWVGGGANRSKNCLQQRQNSFAGYLLISAGKKLGLHGQSLGQITKLGELCSKELLKTIEETTKYTGSCFDQITT